MAVQTPAECAVNVRAAKYENLYLFYGRDTGALEPFAKKLAAKLCPPEAQMMNLHIFPFMLTIYDYFLNRSLCILCHAKGRIIYKKFFRM